MPIICEGSNFSDSKGGIRKPVALVKIVNSRKIAVRPGIRLEPRIPNRTKIPETIAIRLMITCTIVNVARLIPRIMTRPPLFQTAADATTSDSKLPHAPVVPAETQACALDQEKRRPCPSFLHGHQTAPTMLTARSEEHTSEL